MKAFAANRPAGQLLSAAVAASLAVAVTACNGPNGLPTPATGGVPPSATGTPSASGSADIDGETQMFPEDRDIPVPEARRRLGWQVHAPDLAQALQSRPYFGGLWIDVKDGDRVKVGVAGTVTGDIRADVARAATEIGLA